MFSSSSSLPGFPRSSSNSSGESKRGMGRLPSSSVRSGLFAILLFDLSTSSSEMGHLRTEKLQGGRSFGLHVSCNAPQAGRTRCLLRRRFRATVGEPALSGIGGGGGGGQLINSSSPSLRVCSPSTSTLCAMRRVRLDWPRHTGESAIAWADRRRGGGCGGGVFNLEMVCVASHDVTSTVATARITWSNC